MTRLMISYNAKPEAADRNADLSAAVFAELDEKKPDGVSYAVLRSADGTFFHLAAYESDEANQRLTESASFAAFVDGGAERRAGPAVRLEVTVVGNYRMLLE